MWVISAARTSADLLRGSETGGFVTDLFDTIEARSYLPAESPQKVQPAVCRVSADSSGDWCCWSQSSDGAARVKSEITAAGSLAGAPPVR